MEQDQPRHVFISYVHEDAVHVDRLCAVLDAAQIPYWRDRKSLAPGDHWENKVREAISSGALVFLACFSEQSRKKPKSYMNEELTIAVEEFRKFPPDVTWLIPVRFDDGDIPEWGLGAGHSLKSLNYSNLHGDNYVAEAVRLIIVIRQTLGLTSLDTATVRRSVEEAVKSPPAASRFRSAFRKGLTLTLVTVCLGLLGVGLSSQKWPDKSNPPAQAEQQTSTVAIAKTTVPTSSMTLSPKMTSQPVNIPAALPKRDESTTEVESFEHVTTGPNSPVVTTSISSPGGSPTGCDPDPWLLRRTCQVSK